MKTNVKVVNGLESKEKMIISEIKTLINIKNLEPGEKLPSERLLAERIGVTRGSIRNAIQKLEFTVYLSLCLKVEHLFQTWEERL